MESKTFPFECKVNMDSNTFEGYFSIKNNIDAGLDRVMQGAFIKTFSENRKRIKGLYMHDTTKPFSKPLEIYEDSKGAYVKGTISMTSWGQDLKILMADGVVDEMSFGYDVIKCDYENVNGKTVRNLRELKCWEYSPVTWGMNEATSINAVKKLNFLNDLKAGRMISSANRNKIQSVVDALIALLGEEEPQEEPDEMDGCTPNPQKSLNIDDTDSVYQSILQELKKY